METFVLFWHGSPSPTTSPRYSYHATVLFFFVVVFTPSFFLRLWFSAPEPKRSFGNAEIRESLSLLEETAPFTELCVTLMQREGDGLVSARAMAGRLLMCGFFSSSYHANHAFCY